MEKVEEKTKAPRRDVYSLEVNQIKVVEGFNVRQDFGDLQELANSIKINGVKVPVRGYKKEGFYWLTDGERRFRACQLLAEQGVDVRVPFLSDGSNVNNEQRVIDMLICNEGKKLNPVEQSEAVQRLVNYGYVDKEIAEKTGFSIVYISNLKLLNNAPKTIKNLITSDIIRSTQVLKMFRETKSYDEVMEAISKAIDFSGGEPTGEDAPPKKITNSIVEKSQGKINSFSAVKKVMKVADKRTLRMDKIELFNVLSAIYNGSYTVEYLMSELYEPEAKE